MSLGEEKYAKILILGYSKSECDLHEKLKTQRHLVSGESTLEGVDPSKYDLLVSFGLREIIPQRFLENSSGPVVNLHMSLLPMNRGAHPLFWSLLNGERVGVTIHEVDRGLDTGPIIAQKEIQVDLRGNFQDAHALAKLSLEELLLENLDSLLSRDYPKVHQTGPSSLHKVSELPGDFRGWDTQIDSELERLRSKNVSFKP
jgi:methionyl-tRNA formyltransferase